jgi:hypothetical protein
VKILKSGQHFFRVEIFFVKKAAGSVTGPLFGARATFAEFSPAAVLSPSLESSFEFVIVEKTSRLWPREQQLHLCQPLQRTVIKGHVVIVAFGSKERSCF